MVASHRVVVWGFNCQAFLPDVGEDCMTSQKNVCLGGKEAGGRKEYVVYFVAVLSRTCQMSYNHYPMSVNVLPISLLVTGHKSSS